MSKTTEVSQTVKLSHINMPNDAYKLSRMTNSLFSFYYTLLNQRVKPEMGKSYSPISHQRRPYKALPIQGNYHLPQISIEKDSIDHVQNFSKLSSVQAC